MIYIDDTGISKVAPGVVGTAQLQDDAVTDDKINSSILTSRMQILKYAPKSCVGLQTVEFTPVDGTGIPSWAKEINILFNSVSFTSTADHFIQLGSGTYETTGYLSASEAVAYTTAFGIRTATAAWAVKGVMNLYLMDTNTWVMSTNTYTDAATTVRNASGIKTLAGVLDRIRITSSTGTDTFDVGSISLLVKG